MGAKYIMYNLKKIFFEQHREFSKLSLVRILPREISPEKQAGLYMLCQWIWTSFRIWEFKSFTGQAENENMWREMMEPAANWVIWVLPKDIQIWAGQIHHVDRLGSTEDPMETLRRRTLETRGEAKLVMMEMRCSDRWATDPRLGADSVREDACAHQVAATPMLTSQAPRVYYPHAWY